MTHLTRFLTASQALTASTWLVVIVIGVGSVIAATLAVESWNRRRAARRNPYADAIALANEDRLRCENESKRLRGVR